MEHLLSDALVDGVDIVFILRVDKGKPLLGGVCKLLLYDKGRRDLVSHVEVRVLNEAVHLWPKRNRLDYCGEYRVEQGVFKLIAALVLFRDICVKIGKVDALGDVCLVIASVGVYYACDKMHRVDIS